MTHEAVRRVFDRLPNGQPKPATFGAWHLRLEGQEFTLCGQGIRAARVVERQRVVDLGLPPSSGRLCTRCWDRWHGRREPGQFHPGIADAAYRPRPTPSDSTPQDPA